MNRDHQFTPGTESERAAYFCDRCGRSREAHGDFTPPAAPVEPPEHGWCDVCPVCGGHPHCPDHGDRRASNPPAVSGEGERLKEQAAAYRAIALDALACWQGEDEHSDDALKRSRSARSRVTLRNRLHDADRLEFASTPTAQHQQALIDQRVIGHAEGQAHTIADVNAGRVDDLIAPRLAQRDKTIRQQAEQIDRLSAQVEQMARKADDTAAYEAWQIALVENATLRAERDAAQQEIATLTQERNEARQAQAKQNCPRGE